MRRWWFAILALIVVLTLVTPSLRAEGRNGNAKGIQSGRGKAMEKGKPHGPQGAQKRQDKDKVKNRSKAKDRDRRWEGREGFEYRTYGDRDSRPPGWSRGKKTGWGECGVPPGQARKGECRTYRYQGRSYYYYHDDAGRMIVRRPALPYTAR